MKIEGRIWKFGSDVDTDAIIPARYLNQSDPKELAKHVLEEERPEFLREVKKGDILLADKNFGCGSSREHAPLALKAAGVSCIIARTYARIFYRNSLNLGLPLLESPEASEGIKDGDRVRINLATGEIFNLTQNMKFRANPVPAFMQDLLKDGGLIAHLRKKRIKKKR
jgi:3-isopropylmalate dehydratase small subunit